MTRDIVKKLSKNITNGDIECIIADMPIIKKNAKLLFESKMLKMKDKFNFKQKQNIIVTTYEKLSNINSLLKLVNSRLTTLEK